MLTELRISNFALIDQLHLEFPSGFIVLTGETGAGKSLLVDALTLLSGGRASAEHIRSENKEAVLEAAFSIPIQSSLASRLREMDILSAGEIELMIRRVLSRSGRNRTYLNGNLVPAQLVQELAGALIDIHGQHDQQSLLSTSSQLEVLDAFGQMMRLKTQCAKGYADWKAKGQELKEAQTKEAELKSREEFLQFQYQELRDAHLQTGEEEALHQEYQRLKHARRLGELADQAYQALYGQDQSVIEQMQVINQCVKELAKIDNSLNVWPQLVESSLVQFQELADGLRDYRQNLEYDPDRQAEIDDRIAKLQRLKKKYGATIEELIEQARVLKGELEGLSNSQDLIDGLGQQVSKAYQETMRLAKDLSKARHQSARELEDKVKKQLASLGMKHIQFHVQVDPCSDNEVLSPTGIDRVEYLLSTNPGERPHPLARIASGGELSRVMLAIKTVLAGVDQTPVLIFDEIDSGIGGTTATVMGQRLQGLAQYHQVFCITHLPQIASQASTHFVVQKESVNDRTITSVKALDSSERQEEIARMLGSMEITMAVRQTAAEMLNTTPSQKKKSSR